MNAPAFLPIDHRERAARIARIELTAVLARIERWQRDVSQQVLPPARELDKANDDIRKALQEIGL